MKDITLTAIELRIVLQEIFIRTGKDFRNYAYSSIKRRIERIMQNDGCENIENLLLKFQKNNLFRELMLSDIYVPCAEMFRDPETWNAIEKQVFPKLAKKQKIKVAVPNTTSGEEFYAMLFLLKNFGLINKTKVDVSFVSKRYFELAKKINYPIKQLDLIKINMKLLNSKFQISNLFNINEKHFSPAENFNNHVQFTTKKFFRDADATGYDIILFRNRLIYFNNQLQNQIVEHLYEKLNKGGFLILGIGENIDIQNRRKFKIVNKIENIYRK